MNNELKQGQPGQPKQDPQVLDHFSISFLP
jgi:hypothetical protein